MKHSDDTKTGDLLDGFKRPVGRPRSERPLTAAQRQARYLAELRAKGGDVIKVAVPADLLAAIDAQVQKGATRAEALLTFAQLGARFAGQLTTFETLPLRG